MSKSDSTDATVPLGPWVRGINNTDDIRSAVFQLNPESPPFLAKAENVDIDRNGFLKRRVGRTKRILLTSAHSLYSNGDRMFLVDQGVLYELTSDFSLLPKDDNIGEHTLSYTELAGQIFYASKQKTGAVDGFWGVMMPSTPWVTRSTGTLPAGRYMVALTAVREGVESGARQPAVIDVPDKSKLVIDFASIDPNAEQINVYCTQPNGQTLYYVQSFAPTSPIYLESPPFGTDPLTTFGFYPPVPGQRITSFRGHMLLASGNALYWSQPLDYHHFRIQTDVQLFSDYIVLLATLNDGFYVATADSKTYWVGGDEPEAWQPRLVDTRQVIEGAELRLPIQKLPELRIQEQAKEEVVLWITQDGFVAGMNNGVVKHITDYNISVDDFKKASLVYREQEGLRQVLLTLQNKNNANVFGASDKMTARVIRANENIGEP
jgi:hypothetical protein